MTYEYNELNKLYENIKKEKDDLERERDKVLREKRNLDEELEEKTKKLKNAKEENEELESEIRKLKRRVKEVEEEKEDLESKLSKVKRELRELEESKGTSQQSGSDSKSLEKISELEKELTVWKELCPEKDPRELKKLAEEASGYQKKLEELKGKLEEAKKGNVTEDVEKISGEMRLVADKYVNLGKDAGGFMFSPLGGVIGAGLATLHGFIMTGGEIYLHNLKAGENLATRILDDIKEAGNKDRDNAFKFFTNIVDSIKEGEAEKRNIEFYKKEIEKAEETIAGLQKEIEKKDAKIDKLEEKLEKEQEKVEELRGKLEKAQERLLTAQIVQPS